MAAGRRVYWYLWLQGKCLPIPNSQAEGVLWLQAEGLPIDAGQGSTFSYRPRLYLRLQAKALPTVTGERARGPHGRS